MEKRMRKLLYLLTLATLGGCVGGAEPIDAQKFLSGLEGPKVPSMEETMLENAKNAEKQGNFKGAGQIYQQLLEKKPGDKNLILALAESTRRQGEYDRAIALYDAVLAQDATMLAAKEGKGLALISKGDFETPGPILEEVMKADGTRWKTLNALGILFTTRGLYSEAQQYFNAALKQNPSNPSVLNNLGLTQALNKQFDTAIGTLNQASALTANESQDRKRIDLNLSLVYAVAGKQEEARAIAEHYFTGPLLSNNLGLYAHLANDDEMAKVYLNMALTDSKTFYERAWDNLQTINSNSMAAPAAGTPEVVSEPQPDAAPKAESKPVSKDTVKYLTVPESMKKDEKKP
jgi:Flp pilus assembly protein TadD